MMNVGTTAELSASVNAAELVTLYDQSGEPIAVKPDAVERWLARGFTLQRQDLETLLGEVDALGDAIGEPWRAYVAACRSAGHIEPAAQATAHAALELFAGACDRLHRAIHATFPPAPSDEPAAE